MRDDPMFNIKFVQCVEQFPILYNFTLPEYSNRHAVNKAWKTVAVQLQESVADCKGRWKNIRGNYRKALRCRYPKGSSRRPRKPYYLQEFLSFLLPFTKSEDMDNSVDDNSGEIKIKEEILPDIEDTPNSESSHEESSRVQETDSVQDSNHIQQNFYVQETHKGLEYNHVQETHKAPEYNHVQESDHVPETILEESNHDTVESQNMLASNLCTSVMSPGQKKAKGKMSLDDIAISYFLAKSKEQDDDGFLNFFKSFLPEIKKFNDSQKRRCKMAVTEIINNIAELP